MSKKKNTTPKATQQTQTTASQQTTQAQATQQQTQQAQQNRAQKIAQEILSRKEEFLRLFDDIDGDAEAELEEALQKGPDFIQSKIIEELGMKDISNFSDAEKNSMLDAFIQLETYSLPKLSAKQRKFARLLFQTLEELLSEPQQQSSTPKAQNQTQQQATNHQAQQTTTQATQQAQSTASKSQKKSLMDFAEKIISEKEHFSEMLNSAIEQLRTELGLDGSTRADNVPNLEYIIDSLARESMIKDLEKLKGLYESAENYEKRRFIKSLNALLKYCLARAENTFVRTAIPLFFDPLYSVTEEEDSNVNSFIPDNLKETLKGFEAYAYIWTLVNQGKINAALSTLSAAIIKEGEDDASNSLTWVMRKMSIPVDKRVAFFQKVSEKNVIKSRKRLTTIMAAIGF